MDVLHHDLETIEATSLGDLYFIAETLNKVLVDDTVGSSEEGENVGNEVALVIVEAFIPIVKVFGEINFFRGPEGSFGFLVHLPDLWERD
jgi:hypothetical protein